MGPRDFLSAFLNKPHAFLNNCDIELTLPFFYFLRALDKPIFELQSRCRLAKPILPLAVGIVTSCFFEGRTLSPAFAFFSLRRVGHPRTVGAQTHRVYVLAAFGVAKSAIPAQIREEKEIEIQ